MTTMPPGSGAHAPGDERGVLPDERAPRTPSNGVPDYLVTLGELSIIAISVTAIVLQSVPALIVWEVAAVIYLLVGFITARVRSDRPALETGRVGLLDTLSWALPLAASAVGINAALLVLSQRAWEEGATDDRIGAASLGASAILVSWLLLHAGFAQIYETACGRAPHNPGLDFPGTPAPSFADYIYFAYTMGTSFAASDVTVLSTRLRWIVTAHSIVSFLYNALVVAIAFQVLQQIAQR